MQDWPSGTDAACLNPSITRRGTRKNRIRQIGGNAMSILKLGADFTAVLGLFVTGYMLYLLV
jgi:hypothetical protein